MPRAGDANGVVQGMKTFLVYGLARGENRDYMEELLASTCKTEADVERVKKAAGADGWHSFRVTNFQEGERPNFGANLLRR